MSWDLGKVLREGRERAGLSQQALGEKMGASRNTVINWESNRSRPTLQDTRRLCRLLHISAADALGISGLTADERRMLSAFHRLRGAESRALACAMLGAMADEQASRRLTELREQCAPFTYYSTPAAAGTGCLFNDLESTVLYAPKAEADAIIRVSGRSMEPVYHDGDRVYLRCTGEARPGEDVVCTTADGAVIKRVAPNGTLFSVNPALPFGEHYEDDAVRVVGRVVGIVDEDALPDEEECAMLEEFYHKGGHAHED